MSQLSSQRMKVPLEILREIVEVAFFFDYTAGPTLALVCKSINQWITPLLYSSVSLSEKNVVSFIRCVESAQCGTLDTGAYVKKLCIHRNAMEHCNWTLSLCKSITHLLVCPPVRDYDIDEQITDASLWPKPWHVMVLNTFSSWILPRRQLFTHTTHLYVEAFLTTPILSLCATMPLTHICFVAPIRNPNDDDDDDDESFLVHLNQVHFFLGLPLMQCVLIHIFGPGYLCYPLWRLLAGITDERFIVAPWMSRIELAQAFEKGQTVWDDAADWKAWRQMVRSQIDNPNH